MSSRQPYRLRKFLRYFVPMADDEIPPTSLLREFVGGVLFIIDFRSLSADIHVAEDRGFFGAPVEREYIHLLRQKTG